MAESTKPCIRSNRFPKNLSVSVNSKRAHYLRDIVRVKYYTQRKLGKKSSNMKKITKKQYKCNKCNNTFKSINYLNLHNRFKHIKNKYRCPHCSKEYKRQPYFERHVNLHCKTCLVLQHNNSKLLDHMSTCRKEGIENLTVETTNYTCDICTDQFPTHCLLACHRACVHTEKPASYETLYHEFIIGASVVYVCYFCKVSSVDKNYLESHVTGLRDMIDTHIKYSCDLCSENFNTEIDLMQHKLLHDRYTESSSTKTYAFPILPLITNVETINTNNLIPVQIANNNNRIPETVENMGDMYGITKQDEVIQSNIDQQIDTATTSSVENNEAETQSAVQNRNLNYNINSNEPTNAIATRSDATMGYSCEHEDQEMKLTKIEEVYISSDEDDKCKIELPASRSPPIEHQRPNAGHLQHLGEDLIYRFTVCEVPIEF